MNELELKFRLDDAAALRWQQLFKAQGARRRRLRARYVDTPDARLASAQVALRLRLEGTRWVQTLKAPGDSAVHRLEHEARVPGPAAQVPALDLQRHAGTPALERLQAALADGSADQLVPRYETDVWRSIVVLADPDGSQVEAALDLGRVFAGAHEAPVAELELEYLSGPVDTLFARAQDALAAGGAWLSTISKAQQGETLGRDDIGPPVKAQPLRRPEPANAASLLRAVLQSTLAQVLPNASVVAEGRAAAEHIHQLRVGLRRLRTALRELGDFSTRIDPAWEAELASTFAQLGEGRDNEAVAEAVRPLLESAGAPKTTWSPTAAADPVQAVRRLGFQQALLQVVALAHAPDDAYAPFDEDEAVSRLSARLQRLHRQVVKDAKRFMALPLDRQHRVRKRVKRLRYLSEFAWPVWRHKAVAHYLDALKPAQEALGTHADCAVACERFTADAVADPTAQFAAGYLTAHLQTTARAARSQLKQLAKAAPYWKHGAR